MSTENSRRGSDDVATWNRRYSEAGRNARVSSDPWSATWEAAVTGLPRACALDLGCGLGFDTERLLAMGFEVVAVDFSAEAVARSRQRSPQARYLVADIRQLPEDMRGPFELVVANLSLHYFERSDTEAIFRRIFDLLSPAGVFLFRLNAEDEVGAPEDPSSWQLVKVGGVWKQFFDLRKIVGLLKDKFEVLGLEKWTSERFGARKSLYEGTVRKSSHGPE